MGRQQFCSWENTPQCYTARGKTHEWHLGEGDTHSKSLSPLITGHPVTGHPGTSHPGTGQPGTRHPGTGRLGTGNQAPGILAPVIRAPGNQAPVNQSPVTGHEAISNWRDCKTLDINYQVPGILTPDNRW